MRKFIIRLGEALVILMLSLALCEVVLRLAPGVIPLSYLDQFSPTLAADIAEHRNLPTRRSLRWLDRDDGGPPLSVFNPGQRIRTDVVEPGAVREVVMDDTGFCNPPDGADRHVPIIALGDSFTWCTQVHAHETWPSVLGARLEQSTYSLGRPGIGVYEYIQLLIQFGVDRRPDIVILNIYEGNDLRDAVRFQASREPPDAAGDASRPAPSYRRIVNDLLDTWFGRNSYIFNVALVSAVEGGRWLRAALGVGGVQFDETQTRKTVDFRYTIAFPGAAPVSYNTDNTDTDEVAVARALTGGEASLDVMTEGLARFVELAGAHGFQPVVLYTPSAYTAYADLVEFADSSLSEVMAEYSKTQRRFLAEKAQALGFTLIDLVPDLQRAAAARGADEMLYFPRSIHLTKLGHKVVAEIVADRLQRHIQ